MKKLAILVVGFVALQACNPSNNNPGETGAVNDGIKAIDENGALNDADSVNNKYNPSIDSAIGDHRVDTEKRDTSTYPIKNK